MPFWREIVTRKLERSYAVGKVQIGIQEALRKAGGTLPMDKLIDVVHAAVQKNAAAAGGKFDEEAIRIRSGIRHINGATVHGEAQMPFGDVGASGYGSRRVTIQNTPRHYLI